MVFRGWAGYVIRGNPQLCQKFEHLGYDDPRDLLGPTLWKEDVGGTSIYTGEEDMRNMKRFYVACVRYLELPFDEVVRLFGDFPVHEETFDQWWTIEIFNGFYDHTSELLNALRKLNRPDVDEVLDSIWWCRPRRPALGGADDH